MDSCSARRDAVDTADSMEIPYERLKIVTRGFSKDRLLGSGTFGMVYKGTLANGEEIAVKVLNDAAALDEKNFTSEFQNLARLKHQNIVQLVGYCNESENQIATREDGTEVNAEKMHVALCFEYVGNGSLRKHISNENHGHEWQIRYKIIKGICEGLNHLREGFETPIWHLDLKPDNILLDNTMMPKIADFGLSRLIGDDRTRKTLNAVGTLGYLPPEYVRFQLISEGFDLFSLGVIITKIMIGEEGYHKFADLLPRKLINHVHKNWKERLQKTLRAGLLEVYCQQVKKCIEMASKCLNEDRKLRPSVQDIIVALNETETKIPPLQTEQFHDGQSTPASNTRIVTSISTSERDDEAGRSIYKANRLNRLIVTPRKIPYKLLKSITDGLSAERMIGQGGFGIVYKGVYEDGQVLAVKILNPMHCLDGTMFQTDLETLVKAQHENIEQLVGYCDEEEEVIVEHNGRKIVALEMHRALCFEYYPNGSLRRYISDDVDCGLDWCTRYKIIRGTCDGLRHLHEEHNILHLDLTPNNILLDENMTPKIGDFALSRKLADLRKLSAIGTLGYLPPEFIDKQVISKGADIYSLGVTMLRMIAGIKDYSSVFDRKPENFIKLVLENWRKRLQETCKGRRSVDGYCQQVKRCIEIALRCVEVDRQRRPYIGYVVRALEETETWMHDDSELLEVHPMELHFPFKPKRQSSCLLHLHNKQDDHVAFRLVPKNPAKYVTKLPLCSIVPPGCTYTIVLTTCKQPPRPPPSSDSDEGGFVLQSVPVRHRSYLEQALVIRECEGVFNKTEETAEDEVQEVTLKSLCAPPQAGEASSKMARPEVEIISMLDAQQVSSIEVHPENPWIMTTHQRGNLHIWDYNTMATVNPCPIEVPDQPVYVAKFIAREEWIVAGDGNGCIHVLSYDESQDVTSFKAHDGQIMSLAVHPTHNYVLSSSHDDHKVKLWHWDPYWDFEQGAWACTQTFEGHSDKVSQLVFNLEDPDNFASASWDGTVKIWGLKIDACNPTTLDKHPDGLLCVDYITSADHQHLMAGSKDGTVQIWDLETKKCREYLHGHASHITVVSCHPELQKLITGSLDGTVRIWDSTTFRLENIIAFNLGAVFDVGYVEKLKRIVVGCQQGIATMEFK